MPLRPCLVCGELVRGGGARCARHVYRRPASGKRGYGARWRRTRNAFLSSHPVCVRCGRAADTVDHIDGLGPLGPYGHDPANLRAFCGVPLEANGALPAGWLEPEGLMARCDNCGTPFCEACGEGYSDVAGCTEGALPYLIAGNVRWFEPVRYGSPRERWAQAGVTPPDRCWDCACELGRVHHDGCLKADCPVCGGQLGTCACRALQGGVEEGNPLASEGLD